jgi:uncharacterized membrane protein (UPF0127 family)
MRILFMRRGLIAAAIVFLALFTGIAGCDASQLRPHEPLDPAKAQSLQTSVLSIQSTGVTHTFTVELARTERERNIGLMHRNFLAPDRGMLFDFQSEQPEKFWMRNTFIPLDMFFVRSSGEIVYIAENTTPHSEAPVGPDQPVQAVLELVGGTAKRLGLKPGDFVRHPILKGAQP